MTFKLFTCGDIVNSKAKSDFLDDKLKNIIHGCDAAICNFEAPIEMEEAKPIKKAGSHLHQPKDSIAHIKKMGFSIASLANNHIYDYGQKSLGATIKKLQKEGVDFVGGGLSFEEAYRPKIIEKNSIKVGILAGCDNEFGCLYEKQDRGGYAWLLSEKMEDNITFLKKNSDFVVVIAHAGVEDVKIPIKEWRNKYQRFCEIGTDVVIGHHPHVPQGYEKYRKSLIFYSLGNFYFDTPLFAERNDDSYSVVLKFEKEKEIDFEIVYHKKINGQTSSVPKDKISFDLNELNRMLGAGYDKRNDGMCLELFRKYYYKYYQNAMGGLPRNAKLKQIAKYLIKKILFKEQVENRGNLLLLHNIRIDSHRFVVQRALSLLSE